MPVPDPTALLSNYFSDSIRALGAKVPLGASTIHGVLCDSGTLEAKVSTGDRTHVATIFWHGASRPGNCTCAHFQRLGPCEHMWALLRWADRANSKGADIGFEGVAAPQPRPEGRHGPSPGAHSNAGPDAGPDARDRPLDTERRIARLMRSPLVPPSDPWVAATVGDLRIEYRLDLSFASFAEGDDVLRLQTYCARRLKNGRWTDPTTFVCDLSNPYDTPNPEDRRLLNALHESALQSEPYHSCSSAFEGRLGVYLLTTWLADELLPQLASTGRLALAAPTGPSKPLRADSGPPWQTRFSLERDEVAGDLVLDARLVRGAEVLELERVEHLLSTELVIADGALARFDPCGAESWLWDLLEHGPLRAPQTEEDRLLAALGRLEPRALAPALAGSVVLQGEPTPHLYIAPATPEHSEPPEPSLGAAARVECTLSFDYAADARVDPDNPRQTLRRADGTLVTRDPAAEGRRIAEFLAAGARRTAADVRDGVHGTVTARRVPDIVRKLLALGWSVTAEGRVWRQAQRFSAKVSSALDWFELEGGLQFDDERVPFPELLRALRAGHKEVRLGDGSTGMLPEKWLEHWGLIELADGAYGDKLTFRANQGWLLDALLAERRGLDCDDDFEAYRARLHKFRGVEPQGEPAGFTGTLRGYQRTALGWFQFLRDLGFGGCLADDMGLGKTVQVLALLESRRTAERSGPSLVVAPRSLVFNWIDEARRFTPELVVLDYTGPEREARRQAAGAADVLVTTYGTLRRDAVELAEVQFDYVVLDEATAIKNDNSQASKAARLLKADHRLALSGTPVENHLGELWALFEFLNPGMLGRSSKFKDLLSRSQLPGSRTELARALAPFFLRRTKGEVLTELPPKSEQVIWCELPPADRRRYDELREHYRAALLCDERVEKRDTLEVLEALLRLRQAACHSALIDPKRAGDDSAKLAELMPRLAELAGEGHKALVFSQFTSMLALVRARLDSAGIRYEYLDGQTRDRKAPVERFQTDPECTVFLISLKAGGHGLNLTASDYVFLLDPWWNPAVEAQAVDRAHRMGQTRPVIAYRLIARDTVEERVLELQREKRELADALFGEGQGALQDLTRADLRALLA